MIKIHYYRLANGRHPFRDWLMKLSDTRGRVAVLRRVDRLEEGNFGEHRFLEDGVWELKVDVARDIACTTRRKEDRCSSSCVRGQRARSAGTSRVRLSTGKTINCGHENQDTNTCRTP